MCDTLDLHQCTEAELRAIKRSLKDLLLMIMAIYECLLDLRTYLFCKEELDEKLVSPLVRRLLEEEQLVTLRGRAGILTVETGICLEFSESLPA